MRRNTLGFLAGVIVVAVMFYFLGERAARNTEGIRVSCTLLSNVIAQATAPASRKTSKIIVGEVLLEAEENGRPEVVLQYRRAIKDAPPLKRPDCEQVANDPGSVTPIPAPTPEPPPPFPHNKPLGRP